MTYDHCYFKWLIFGLVVLLFIDTFNVFVLSAKVSVPVTLPATSKDLNVVGANMQVNLAVLLPNSTKYQFSLMRVRPVIDVTITRLQHQGMFPRDVIKVMYADSKCSSVYAPIEAFNFMTRRDNIHAYIGPVCDYALAPVARYSSVWKIPVLTPGGLAHDFSQNKTENPEFALLTRTGSNFNTLAQLTHDITVYYKWDTLVVLYEVNGFPEVSDMFCYLAASALVHWSKKAGSRAFEFGLFDTEQTDYEEMLKKKVGSDHAGKKV